MLATLDLDPEWGAIDLVTEVEETFGIKFTRDEIEPCATMGDLYELLCSHTPSWDGLSGACASSVTFYRIRRSLDPNRALGITPQSTLNADQGALKLFKKLGRDTGLRLPDPRQTWLGISGGLIFTAGLLAALTALLSGAKAMSGLAVVVGAVGIPLISMDRGKLPWGIVTVGDLVRRTAPLNTRSLTDGGSRPADRWSILTSLASEHGALLPDEITSETFLHRRSLELATAA